MDRNALIFDVGKTHVKITVVNGQGRELATRHGKNRSVQAAGYLRLDIDGIWAWFVAATRKLAQDYEIGAIAIATHGAAAVIVDKRTGQTLLPPMDYEFADYGAAGEAYDRLRPDFSETFSPNLPLGLNLGRQLHYQFAMLSEAERQAAQILLYPNYWAWKLTGVASSEVTSLGCHTDLWNVRDYGFSSYVLQQGMASAFPPIVSAWEPLGKIRPDVAEETGLPGDVIVLPGMHDSNASYFPYLRQPPSERPTVISTGTWSIVCSASTPVERLDPARDMLANVDAQGSPVSTARYMGGREFMTICELTGSDIATECSVEDIADILSSGVMALPSFGDGSGPFGNLQGTIIGQPDNGKALATVYSALMLDRILTELGVDGKLVIEGSFARNDLLCSLLAALRPDQFVAQYPRPSGVVGGCFHALCFDQDIPLLPLSRTPPLQVTGLDAYREKWVKAIGQQLESAQLAEIRTGQA